MGCIDNRSFRLLSKSEGRDRLQVDSHTYCFTRTARQIRKTPMRLLGRRDELTAFGFWYFV
jgi:hypothetical protein